MISDVEYTRNLGRAIKRLRLERSWTQTELAKRIGTTQSAISEVESGGNVTILLLRRILTTLSAELHLHYRKEVIECVPVGSDMRSSVARCR